MISLLARLVLIGVGVLAVLYPQLNEPVELPQWIITVSVMVMAYLISKVLWYVLDVFDE